MRGKLEVADEGDEFAAGPGGSVAQQGLAQPRDTDRAAWARLAENQRDARGDTQQPVFALLVIDRPAGAPYLVERFGQPWDGRSRTGCPGHQRTVLLDPAPHRRGVGKQLSE